MPRFDVVGLGSAACDYVTRLDHLPDHDEKIRTDAFLMEGGGSVATALVTAARLGMKTAFAGCLGEDEFGRFILDGLEREGVDTSFVQVSPHARSPFAFCMSVPPSRAIISIRPSTPPLVLEDEWLGAFLDTRFVHFDGRESAAIEVARRANARGVGVSVDLQEVDANSDKLLALADVAVVSQVFARARIGESTPEAAVSAIFRPGMQLAAITYGDQGAVAIAGGAPFRVPAELVEVVDSTGAGDVFHGALLVGLLTGQAAERALALASHVAALSCRALGSRDGIPIRDELGGTWF